MSESDRRISSIVFGTFGLLAAALLGVAVGAALYWGLSPADGRAAASAQAPATAEADAERTVWTCSMHPQIRQYEPGNCPICGMDLVVAASASAADAGGRAFVASEAARALMDVRTAPVERKFVEADVRLTGKVAYDETRLAQIAAWVPGRLDRVYVDYTGVPVRKGDHLVEIYSPDLLAAQQELLQARRAVEALSGGSDSAREMAQSTLESAREKLRLWGLTAGQIDAVIERGAPSDHVTIYAPIGGIVIHRNATEGMYVETGTRIYTIADLSQVWVQLDAYESDLVWLRYGQDVEFTSVSYPGETFHGRIAFIDPVLDPRTRTVNVRLDAPNPDGRLKPGMFVRAVVHPRVAAAGKVMSPDLAGKWICPMHPSIVKDQAGECDICGMPLVRSESLGYVGVRPEPTDRPLVVPASAVLKTGTRAVVYVEDPAAESPTYHGRVVALGPRAGDYYIVRTGLEEGERVVTRGNFKIDSALQIQARPSMMMPADGSPAATTRPGAEDPAPREPAPRAFRRQLAPLLESYYAVSEALANDDFAAGRDAASKLARRAGDVDPAALDEPGRDLWETAAGAIRELAGAAAEARTIDSARSKFALLSEEAAAVLRYFGAPSGAPAYELHCPMAFDGRGANWLQASDAVRNPYFGAAMPRCGSVTQTYAPPDAGANEADADPAGADGEHVHE